MRKKIYISNALRGLPNNILKPLYANITNRLAQKGYDISYPVGEMGAAFLKYTIPPDCDGLYPFNGWEWSHTGQSEMQEARERSLLLFDTDAFEEIPPFKISGKRVFISGGVETMNDSWQTEGSSLYLREWGFEPVHIGLYELPFPPEVTIQEYMKLHMDILRGCDGVLLVTGYDHSPISLREQKVARKAGIPIYKSREEIKQVAEQYSREWYDKHPISTPK